VVKKVASGSLTLYHVEQGRHRDVLRWWDDDHKPEVLGTLPNVFLSQRWVAPPEWVALRPVTELPYRGGEYANLYWSSGSVAELERDFTELGTRLARLGRSGPTDLTRLWPSVPRRRLRPTLVAAGPGATVSADAVPAVHANTGLTVLIGEYRGGAPWADFCRWQESEQIPALLDMGLYSGIARFVSDAADLHATYVLLAYTDAAHPESGFAQLLDTAADRARGPYSGGHHTVFAGIYQPSIGHYEIYD
jgi:hypothetical protein